MVPVSVVDTVYSITVHCYIEYFVVVYTLFFLFFLFLARLQICFLPVDTIFGHVPGRSMELGLTDERVITG